MAIFATCSFSFKLASLDLVSTILVTKLLNEYFWILKKDFDTIEDISMRLQRWSIELDRDVFRGDWTNNRAIVVQIGLEPCTLGIVCYIFTKNSLDYLSTLNFSWLEHLVN